MWWPEILIKSMRADKFCFLNPFLDDIIFPETGEQPPRYALRTHGTKQTYTVTGQGVFARNSKDVTPQTPLKPKQYSDDQKRGYSKIQSTSLVLTDFHPTVFGHDKDRRDKLVCFAFPVAKMLLSQRLYIYDGGTVGRPYDFSNEADALAYEKRVKNTLLFAKEDYEKFKEAIKQNKDLYNEVLARLRWIPNDPEFFILIASDTFEARMIALTYAEQLQFKLKTAYPHLKIKPITIRFYLPENTLDGCYYDETMQEADKAIANQIADNNAKRKEKIKAKNWEYLLGLSSKKLKDILDVSHSALDEILKEGMIETAQWLLDKLNIETATRLAAQCIAVAFSRWSSESKIQLVIDIYRHKSIWFISSLIKHLEAHSLDQFEINSLFINSGGDNQPDLALLAYKNGAFANAVDKNAETAVLHIASIAGFVAVVEKLIAVGISLNGTDRNGLTALLLASREGQTAVVERLLAAGISMNATDKDGSTALHLACSQGHTTIVEKLLAAGIMMNVTNKKGETALHLASGADHAEVVEKLLAAGIAMNVIDNNGSTALEKATRYGRAAVVEKLLAYGKTAINVKNKNGFTAFHTAVRFGQYPKVVEKFLAAGIAVNEVTEKGYTALHHAMFNWKIFQPELSTHLLEILIKLIEHGGDLLMKDPRQLTPLDHASDDIKRLLLTELLTKKVNPGLMALLHLSYLLTPNQYEAYYHLIIQNDFQSVESDKLFHKSQEVFTQLVSRLEQKKWYTGFFGIKTFFNPNAKPKHAEVLILKLQNALNSENRTTFFCKIHEIQNSIQDWKTSRSFTRTRDTRNFIQEIESINFTVT